jgi:oxygen-independent coproporphyrinogen-3 oxidase
MDTLIPAYMQALCMEIASVGKQQPGIPVHTVFWGGGTPSMIPPSWIEEVYSMLRQFFEVLPEAEITLEANPNDLTEGYARALFAAGVNRLSIGAQSANERELQLYERGHTHAATVEAVRCARAAGFSNISLDLMFGNPGQTIAEWRATLHAAVALLPSHISLYGLEIKGGTVLKQQMARGELTVPSDDETAEMYEMAREMLKQAGFIHYEISNWAQPGWESRHNRQYWLNRPYFGFGAGAHGYVAGHRTIAVRSPQRYVALASEVQAKPSYPRSFATSKCVRVSAEDEVSETIMLGLRLVRDGIDRRAFEGRFGVDLVTLKQPQIERLATLGLVEVNEDAVRLAPAAYFISNRVIAELA